MEINNPAISVTTKMDLSDPVSTVMSRSVVVANQFHNFSEVLELFSKHGMHHLPIMDGSNHLIGIVSSNDLMKIFSDPKYKNLSLNTDEADKIINIKDIMTTGVHTLTSKDTIKHAAKLFEEKKILALPVVDNGQIVGILSVKDIVYGLAYYS
jgi:CBS domain-containing protein